MLAWHGALHENSCEKFDKIAWRGSAPGMEQMFVSSEQCSNSSPESQAYRVTLTNTIRESCAAPPAEASMSKNPLPL